MTCENYMKCKFYCPKMNKVLLEYSHAHSFTHICRGFHTTMSELWPCNKACLWMVLSLPCSAVQQPADLRDVVIMPLFQVPSVSLYRNHCCILFTSTVTVMSKPTKLNQKKKRRVGSKYHAFKSQWIVDYFVKELDRKALSLLYSDTTTVLKEYGITE